MATKKRRKKMNKYTLVVFKLFGIFSFIFIGVFSYYLWKLNILPFLYYFGIVFGVLFLDFLAVMAIFLFKKPFKIFGFVFICFFSLISGIGTYYTYHTDVFLNRSFKNMNMIASTTFYVVSATQNNYQGLDDITGEVGHFRDAYLIGDAMSSLQSNSIKVLVSKEYEDVTQMFQELVEQKVDTILVEQSSYQLVFEINKELNQEDFEIVHSFQVDTVIQNQGKQNKEGRFTVYVGGNDFTNANMDFNMLISVNVDTHQVLLTSFPRDYYIPVAGFDGRKDTLSYMGARGIETNLQSLREFLEIPIDYFMKVNTKSLVGIVDQVGGIQYCSETSYTTTHATILDDYDDSKGQKLNVQKGCQKLSGIEALTVARERKAFPDGDRQRQKNCQKIILAILEQLKSMNTITNYNNILNSVHDLYQTDIPREVITELIKNTIEGASWKVESQSVDGSDSRGYVHLTNLQDYVMKPNMDTVNQAKEKMNALLK